MNRLKEFAAAMLLLAFLTIIGMGIVLQIEGENAKPRKWFPWAIMGMVAVAIGAIHLEVRAEERAKKEEGKDG